MRRMTANAELYEAILEAAKPIIAAGGFYGECAQRKVDSVSAGSGLGMLTQVSADLLLIADQLDAKCRCGRWNGRLAGIRASSARGCSG